MTSINMRIKHKIHNFVKPTTRYLLGVLNKFTLDLVKEKEARGWDLELTQKIRRVFERFERETLQIGDKVVTNRRAWVRQLFDLMCLHFDVEGVISIWRWKLLMKLLKEENLIDFE